MGTGTSQGVPMIGCKCDVCRSDDPKDKRLRSAIYVKYNGMDIMIDAGPDLREQLLREDIDHLDAVILTHEHWDHTGGLDDVRAFNYLEKRAFPLYLEKRAAQSIKKEYYYAFGEDKYPGAPDFELHTIDENPFSIKNNEIIPIRVYHGDLPILGFRIGDMAYITDASYIPNEEFKKLEGLTTLILNTVRVTSHPSHFSLPQAVAIAERVGAKQTWLTHLSHQLGRHRELMKSLPDNIQPAYDGLRISM